MTPEIKVLTPAEELVLSCEEGIIPVAFNVNVDWKAEIKEAEAQQWCGISPSKGGKPGDNVLNVICIENKGTDNRTATVVIKAMDAVHELVITQLQKDVLVLTAKKDYDIAYQGDTLKFNVSHNLDLKIRSDVDWIKEVKTKGLVEEAHTFIVEPNAGEARTGKITFTADPFEEVITVNQAAWVLEFAIDPAEGKAFEPEGGEHKVKVASNVEYTVTMESNNWLTMTRNGDEYTFKAVANEGLVARDVDVRFAPKSAKHISAAKVVNISQKGKGAKLDVTPLEHTFTYFAQEFTVTVDATIDYEIVYVNPDDEQWLTYAVSENVYTFSATENTDLNQRVAQVTFVPTKAAYSDMVQTLTVTQYSHAFRMWVKQIAKIEGYDTTLPLRLALYGEKLLLSNSTKIFILDPATGDLENTISLPEGVVAHSLLVDDADNLMIAADGAVDTEMTLYHIPDPMNPVPEVLLTYHTGNYYGAQTGNFRVKGNINDDAVITAVVSDGQDGENIEDGAVLIWEFVDGELKEEVVNEEPSTWFWTNVPYTCYNVASLCCVPAGNSLADGLFYIGYAGDRSIQYASSIVKNPQKSEVESYISATEWTTSYVTGSEWKENHNCIATAEWRGTKYAAVLKGCHFDYCNADMVLVDVTDPSAGTLVYEYLGEFDVPRGDNPNKAGEGTWDNLWWTDPEGQTMHYYSDILLIPTDEAILMIGADSAYGTLTCVAVM